jgi:hypothetical protein
MRVDGATGNQSSLVSNPVNANRPGTSEGVAADSSAFDPSVAAGQFQSSSELVPLQGALSQIPFVRQEVVGEVVKQLSGGDLDTPQARQQTVQSILGSSPGHD